MSGTTIKKSYSASEKATIALEALKGNITFNAYLKSTCDVFGSA